MEMFSDEESRVNLLCLLINLFGGFFFGVNSASVAPAIQYVNDLSNCSKWSPRTWVDSSSNFSNMNGSESFPSQDFSSSASSVTPPILLESNPFCSKYSWTQCTWSEIDQECYFADGIICSRYSSSETACSKESSSCFFDKKSSTCQHRVGWSAVSQGLVAGSIILGAAMGSLIGGFVAEKIGRRKPLICLSSFGLLALSGCVASWQLGSAAGFIVSRVLVGFSVGVASVVCPLYVGEMATPKKTATALGLVFQVAIVTAGYLGAILLFAFLDIDYSSLLLRHLNQRGGDFGNKEDSLLAGQTARFQIFHGLAALGALGLLISSFLAEESTAWTRKQFETLLDTFDGKSDLSSAQVDLANEQVEHMISGGEVNGWSVRGAGAKWPRWKVFALALSLAAILQAEGINALLCFAPTMMKQIGVDPATGNFVVFSWFWFTTVFTFCVQYCATPRSAYGYSSLAIVGSCVLVGVATLPAVGLSDMNVAILGGIGIGIFAAAFHAAVGPYFFFLSQSVFPPEYRDLGCRTAQISQFVLNIAVNVSFPIALNGFNRGSETGPGLAAMFFIFAILGAVSTCVFFLLAPVSRPSGVSTPVPEIE